MATTETIVMGDGGNTYSFSFPYLKKEDVKVELQEYDSAQTGGLEIVSRQNITAFTIPANQPTQVVFDAIGADTTYQTAPDGDVKVTSTNGYPVRVRIYRFTDAAATPATFSSGSAIRAKDLNDNFEQTLFIMQERQNTLNTIATGGIGENTINTNALQDNSVTDAKLRSSSTDDSLRSVTNDHIRDGAVTTEKISGNIKIGTTGTPAATLHIADSTPVIRIQDTDGTEQHGEITQSGNALILNSRNNASNGQIVFNGRGGGAVDEYARFNTNGYLGIGTQEYLGINPAVPLHIATDGPNFTRIRLQQDNSAGGGPVNQYGDIFEHEGGLYLDSRNNTGSGPIIFRGFNGEYGRFTTAGNLGVGVSSPTEKLHVGGNILATGSISSSSAGIGIAAPVKSTVQIKGAGQQGSLTDSGNTDNILRLGANGNAAGDGGALSFACNASDTASSVGYAAVKGLVRDATNNNTGHISFQTRTTSTATSFTEKARITSDGAFFTHLIPSITTSTNQGVIGSKGYLSLQGTNGSAFANPWNFYWTGAALQAWVDSTNVGNVSLTSDYRTKREVTTQTESGIDKVKLLRPVTFKRTAFGDLFLDEDVVREGFIAHEVGEVIPSGCEGEKDAENQIQSLNIDAIVSVLTKALQETIAKVEQLEAQVAALQG